MNLRIFSVNEIVQALDDSTSIWEKAKITGVISDWSVLVRWVNWKPATAPATIFVPDDCRRNQGSWNIRKAIYGDNIVSVDPDCASRRTLRRGRTDNHHKFNGNPRFLTKYEEVFFWDVASEKIKKGSIIINDPFLHNLTVKGVEDDVTWTVAYSSLRSGQTLQVSDSPDASDNVDTELPPVVDTELLPTPPHPPKKAKISQEMPEVDMLSVVECEETEVVPLTYVPCVNGILKVGTVAVCAGEDFAVEKLEFVGSRKKAFALLKSLIDEDTTTRMPAVKVTLKDANYLKTEVSKINLRITFIEFKYFKQMVKTFFINFFICFRRLMSLNLISIQ